jgi:hypothetical protein
MAGESYVFKASGQSIDLVRICCAFVAPGGVIGSPAATG